MCQICGLLNNAHEDGIVSADPYVPSTAKAVATTTQIVEFLTTQWPGQVGYTRTWQNKASLTYSVPSTTPDVGSAEAAGFKAMSAAQVAAARVAFELWDDVIAISLNEVAVATANITFAYSTKTNNGGNYARTWTSYTGSNDLALTKASVWLNASTWTHDTDADMFQGGYGVLTYLHEIGHTLGLSHPGTYDVATGAVTYATAAKFAQDTRQFTLMSYFQANADGTGTDHVGSDGQTSYAATPLLYDIAAAQAKYGADLTTRTGATVYGFNSTAGRDAYDFARNPNPVIAIWDAGGVDTLDVSGFAQNQRVTLVAGAYSDVGAMTNNVAIAFGAVIENAIGGSGSDLIEGNDAANRLVGGGGADTVYGGNGDDTLEGGAGNDVLHGGAGADVFVFTTNAGSDRIEGFVAGSDKIRFDGLSTVVTSFASLTLTGQNGGTLVSWSGGSVFLAGVAPGAVTAADFGLTGSQPAPAPAPTPTPTPDPAGLVLYGTEAADTLNGGAGDDRLYGGSGNDFLYGGAGADLLDGGAWWDTVSYSAAASAVSIFVDPATGQGAGDARGDRFVGIESFVLSAFGDTFFGTAAGEQVRGGGGADTIHGGGGADTLLGEAGADVFVFGTSTGAAVVWDFVVGSDKIRIDAPGVTSLADLTLVQQSNGVLVSWGVAGASVLVANAAAAQLTSSAFEFVAAPAAPPPAPAQTGVVLNGTTASDTLVGGAGDDSLFGREGNDTLEGGAGADLLDGAAGFDVVTFQKASSGVVVDLQTGARAGDASGDVFVGVERFYLTEHADRYVGTTAADSVYALGGNDTLAGGGGADAFVGGLGSDLFLFGAETGARTIWDFQPGVDRIGFDAPGVSSFSNLTLTQQSNGVLVTWGVAGASLLLYGQSVAQVTAGSFVFGAAASVALTQDSVFVDAPVDAFDFGLLDAPSPGGDGGASRPDPIDWGLIGAAWQTADTALF